MNIEYFMKIEIKHEISKVSGKQGSKRKGRMNVIGQAAWMEQRNTNFCQNVCFLDIWS